MSHNLKRLTISKFMMILSYKLKQKYIYILFTLVRFRRKSIFFVDDIKKLEFSTQ